jgi:hypothetical protein
MDIGTKSTPKPVVAGTAEANFKPQTLKCFEDLKFASNPADGGRTIDFFETVCR